MATVRPLSSTGSPGAPGFANGSKAIFPSPFLDITDLSLPRDVKSILRVCEAIYFYNPTVKAGIDRLVSLPVTSFEYGTDSQQLKEVYDKIYTEILDLSSALIEVGKDVYVYGNSFVSLYFPFDRYLTCSACKMQTPIRKAKFKFSRFKFTGRCACGYEGEMGRIDRRSLDVSRLRLIRWNPHNMHILHNDISGKNTYWYQLDGQMRSKIIAGDPDILADTPWEFVVAVQKGQKFKFKEGMLYHIKQPTLAGRHRAWGLPPTLPLLKYHFFVAALRRANIAVAYDMSVPFRVMYPERGGATGDPATQLNIKKWLSETQKMVRNHRLDPTAVKFAPGPVGYQSIGGEARALLYSQEIRQANEEIMNALQIPQDIMYGTLTAQAAPISLRMLYNSMSYYLGGVGGLLNWVTAHTSEYFDFERVPVRLRNFAETDDTMRTQAIDMLGQMGKLSDRTVFEAHGLDADTEYRKLLSEQQFRAKVEEEFQKDTQQSGGPGGATPGDIVSQAKQIAAEWLALPLEQRRSQMFQLDKQDPVLYQQALKELRILRDIGRQGGAPPGMEAQALTPEQIEQSPSPDPAISAAEAGAPPEGQPPMVPQQAMA
jgi:hypothetical protein